MENKFETKLNKHFSKHKNIFYKKGQILIRAGEEPSGAFFLKKGYVKMSYIFENGVEIIFNIFKPGSLFPIIWVVGEVENSYYYQAMTDIEVFKSPKQKIIKLLNNNPDILFNLTKRIVIGFDGLLLNIRHMLFGNSLIRVSSAIYIMVKRFGKRKMGGKYLIDIKLTHQDIASLSGISRETASIAIKKLERNGVITQQKGYLLVNDIKKLEKRIAEVSSENISPIPDA
jgi:CRP/FNR family transcriptional regulator